MGVVDFVFANAKVVSDRALVGEVRVIAAIADRHESDGSAPEPLDEFCRECAGDNVAQIRPITAHRRRADASLHIEIRSGRGGANAHVTAEIDGSSECLICIEPGNVC